MLKAWLLREGGQSVHRTKASLVIVRAHFRNVKFKLNCTHTYVYVTQTQKERGENFLYGILFEK